MNKKLSKVFVRLLVLVCLVIIGKVNAQVLTNGTTQPNLNGQNPFIDASTNFDSSVSNNNEGKGLVFPRTDLTLWVFKTDMVDGISFPTAFDGMMVYNTGTGQTLVGQGIQVTVEPGFYYFYNPNATTDITNGKWTRLKSTVVTAAAMNVLIQIGNEGDAPDVINSVVTAVQLTTVVDNVVPANEIAYQNYIDANPNLFSSPATVAEVQAMVNTVNAIINAILVQIGNEGDNPNVIPSLVSTTQLNQLPVTGVIDANQGAYQAYIDANPNLFSAPATVAEVQAMITTVNTNVNAILVQIGNEGDAPDLINSVVTAVQLTTVVDNVVPANEIAYQNYIDANPNLFSSPATVAEVQAMVNTVNAIINAILVQIGNEGDNPNVIPSLVSTTQLNQLPVTGVIDANQGAYQAYIDANPNLFSAPATVAEVQAMITTVNANVNAILVQIGNEGDNPNNVPSVVTIAQLDQLGVDNVVPANETAYQDYIDNNPNLFSSPATIAEVQEMINNVNGQINSVLIQIGNEGDSPDVENSVVTVAQLNQLPVTGVVADNEIAYQNYIDNNPNSFSSPATIAEVQAMITTVNAAINAILVQIGNEGDDPDSINAVVTVAQLNQLPVTGVVAANESAYQDYIDANPNLFSAPATVAEVQAMITAVNASQSVLAQIGAEGDSPNAITSTVTVAQINTISPTIIGAFLANQSAYQAYIDANPNLFSAPATAAEVQSMIDAVNASQSVLAQIGAEGDSPNIKPSLVTVAQINTISPAIIGAIVANEAAYQAYIDANPNLFSATATVAEVQAMIDAVNASQSVLAQIGAEGDSPNAITSSVTVAQINTISPAIIGAIVANEAAYQAYIDANPNLFSAPATVAEVQAMINAVNASQSVLAQIGAEGDSPNAITSTVTVAQINTISPAITGAIVANQSAYQAYIDANPNLFSAPATAAEVQAMIDAVNASQSVLAQIGAEGDSPNAITSTVTVAQINTISPAIIGAIVANEAAYQAYIDTNPNLFSAPATVAEVQAMIDAVNASQSVLAQIGAEGDSPNAITSTVTVAQINTISPAIIGAIVANEAAYQAYIDANPNLFSAPATAAEVQAMIDAVNASQSVLAQIGAEGDSPNAITSTVTVAQINTISPAIIGAIIANQSAYQAYIDANPNLFSAPATVAEVQAMIDAVNASQSVLAQIGAEGDSPNAITSTVTVAQINTISPAIIGAIVANQSAYQAYIDANPNLFSAPATAAEVQAMIDAVNASQSVLAQIGAEGDSPNAITSTVTVAQINTISPAIIGAIVANEAAYQAYIDTNPNLFSAPATVAEVQAMIDAVNASQSVLAQIGAEGDSPNAITSTVTVAQINTISPAIIGAIVANEAAYQAYIDANPNLFSAPATAAEVQAMIDAVNASQSVLAQIGAEGDSPNAITSTVTVAQINTISPAIIGAIIANQSAYQAYIDANPNLFSAPATVAEVQAMIDAVNASQSVLAQIGAEGDSPNAITSTVTVAQINTISPAIIGAIVANEAAYQAYIDANPNLFSAPATAPEVQAMITIVNAFVTSGGTAEVTAYSCSTASAGILTAGTPVSGVTQTITATVATVGTYSISTPFVNGISFSGNGTFTATGNQDIVLTAIGNPATAGTNSFSLNTTPTCSFDRTIYTVGVITSLTCGSATHNGTLTDNVLASGVSSTIPYTGGNGGAYAEQTVNSTGVTGLTATLAAGTFASGAGTVTYTIEGTPVGSGTASFAITLGGQSCTFTRNVALGTLPNNITLSSIQPYFIASVFDQDYLPYTLPIAPATLATAQAANGVNEAKTLNVQGSLTTTGVSIKIPYTTTASVNLPAFSQIITIPAAYTEDGISRDIKFSYTAQTLAAGSGSISATLQAVGGALNAKKLDMQTGIGNDYLGVLLGQFTYSTNSSGGTAGFAVRDIAPFPDRNVANANHVMFYLPVTAEDGNVWLNNNLGADYSNTAKASFNPGQQAMSATDFSAYGSLFQWGRLADGHELINWTSAAAGAVVNGTTTGLSGGDTPANASFIINIVDAILDWRSSQNNNLWQGALGTNNPCPWGFRLPTITEYNAHKTIIGTGNANAYNSALKITLTGNRNTSSGSLTSVGTQSNLWSSTVFSTSANNVVYGFAGTGVNARSWGFSVRCIRDTNVATVASLNCGGATNSGSLVVNTAASGVSSSIPYTGGNGVVQYGQAVASTGVTGLIATLAPSTLASGAGSLTYTITGTPTTSGTASFDITVGGQSCTFTRTVAALPANITLSAVSPYFITSVNDQDYLPYTVPTVAATLATAQPANGVNEANTLNIQGTLTTTGVTIRIPYTVVTAAVALPAFSQTITIPASYAEDGISRDITFSYAAQPSLAVGTGYISATLKSVGGTLNVKKLDEQTGIGNDNLGFLLGQFTYATNNSGGTTTFDVRAIALFPDRNVNDASHQMFYAPVMAENGSVWLNNNLGADYANTAKGSFNPIQQAMTFDDFRAYGSLVQWGKPTNGHELVNWTNSTTGIPLAGPTGSQIGTDTPPDSLFYVNATITDWRNPQNDNLWQGVSGINNPCPLGFRVPTTTDFGNLVAAAGITNIATAANSALKISVPGRRLRSNGVIGSSTVTGEYWTTTVSGTTVLRYSIDSTSVTIPTTSRGQGQTVRCIKN